MSATNEANEQEPQAPPTQPQRVLETDYSYVNVEVPLRSERSSANKLSPTGSIQSSAPHRGAIVANPVVLSYQRTTEVEAGTTSSTGPAASGGNKIKTSDVANIFRASTTVQAVNSEQIQRIEKMHDKIREGAIFNFNYICLLIIASFVAGLGLASDSSTIVVSSMLLSPIMGPVIGMAYGLIVCDWHLVRQSIRNELISLVISILIGMIIGVSVGWTDLALETWPTHEMSSRGELTNFLVGIPVAWLSGLGVALSVLDDQTSSLVGVAVSASLLPPAVNAGLCWLCSFVLQSERAETEYGDYLRDQEFARMGGMSLALTVVNIVLVALSSAFMFRIKEILPVKKNPFWNDLKTARKINQKMALRAISFDSEEEEER